MDDRQFEAMAMRHVCPLCGARGGEVCDPFPYPSFEDGRRVHEIRYEGPFDIPRRVLSVRQTSSEDGR